MEDAAQFDVGGSRAKRGEDDRRVAHELLDRLRREFGMQGKRRRLLRMLGQHLHRGGQLVARGVSAGVEEDGDKVDQLVVGEPVAVFVDAVGSEMRSSPSEWRRRAIR